MRWNKKEEKYLIENYSTRIPLEEISKKLGRTIISIRRKAGEMKVSRPRKTIDLERKRLRQRDAFKRYYKKHSKKVFERKKKKRIEKKSELILLMGGKCNICGYNKCEAALEFHHKTSNKEGNIAHIIKNRSKEKALKEIKKCILVCANCHRELHHSKGS